VGILSPSLELLDLGYINRVLAVRIRELGTEVRHLAMSKSQVESDPDGIEFEQIRDFANEVLARRHGVVLNVPTSLKFTADEARPPLGEDLSSAVTLTSDRIVPAEKRNRKNASPVESCLMSPHGCEIDRRLFLP